MSVVKLHIELDLEDEFIESLKEFMAQDVHEVASMNVLRKKGSMRILVDKETAWDIILEAENQSSSNSGKTPSKKNRYRSKPGGKGVFIDSRTEEELGRLALQIPGDVRGLKILHPDIDFYFTVPKSTKHDHAEDTDRDSKVTSILDLLVQYDVIAGDSIRLGNGLIRIFPAKVSDHHYSKVVVTPACPDPDKTEEDRPCDDPSHCHYPECRFTGGCQHPHLRKNS